jgi:outer membrane protein OmpA-like peptidoglycan-associated protein
MHLFHVPLVVVLAIPALPQDPQVPPPLPSYFVISPQAQLKPDHASYEVYGEAEFLVPHGDKTLQRGKHWAAVLTVPGAPADAEPDDVWVRNVKPALINAGWKFFAEEHGQPKTARYQKDGHDSWLVVWIQGSDDMRLDLVEVGPCPISISLPKPADKPEIISPDSGDFPFLPPIAGSTLSGGHHDEAPMIVNVQLDSDHSEDRIAGMGSIIKNYNAPPFPSPVLFETVYSKALKQAGWKVIRESHSADAAVTAHYAAGERDLWAYLHGGGGDYFIQVADEGDLAAQLDRDCHVAVYGIQFDFDKSTIRADSEPVLQRVLGILNARPDLKLEIQGHTDNVGSGEYNQRLSEARATSVVAWLVGKGITQGHLTAQGYGMSQPIADNGNDEGRARNRRVELKKQGCTKQ